MIRQVRGRLGHAPRVARWAHTTAFAGEGHKEVVPAVVTAGAGKAVGKDAAFEVFAKGLLDVGGWRVVVALAVELAGTCQLKPGLEVLGHCAVQQGLLGVAGVVELGFGLARRVEAGVLVRMRLRVLRRGAWGSATASVAPHDTVVTSSIAPCQPQPDWRHSILARSLELADRVAGDPDLRAIHACIHAAQLAGALMQVFTRTLQYANDRNQLRRPLGGQRTNVNAGAHIYLLSTSAWAIVPKSMLPWACAVVITSRFSTPQ